MLLGDYPQRLALIGVQPVELDDYGGSLRPQVKACIPEALQMAVRVLREWGLDLVPRSAGAGKDTLAPSPASGTGLTTWPRFRVCLRLRRSSRRTSMPRSRPNVRSPQSEDQQVQGSVFFGGALANQIVGHRIWI